MYKPGIQPFILCGVLIIIACSQTPKPPSVLWPELQPYQTGYIDVGDGHQIYFQLGGDPNGFPAVYLHGGPGGQATPKDFRYFNPDFYHILLYDQRGAGQSKPFASLTANTTWNLVEDIERLRTHFHFDKILILGGSWGSTLALAYAETYPEHVAGLILRGVFTATQSEIDHFYHGGTAAHFPANFDSLLAYIPRPDMKNYPSQLLAQLLSEDSLTCAKTAWAWAAYEAKLAFLNLPAEKLAGWKKSWNPLAFSRIENYYMANHCFLQEGQLWTNLNRISHIPVTIVNGRYDVICPPITAYKLHQQLPKSKLIIVEEAGHSASEPGIQAALVKAAGDFESIL